MRILRSRQRYKTVLSKSLRLTLMDVYMAVICMFPIATTLVNEGVINKILFGLILALQVGQTVMNPMKKSSFFCLFILASNLIMVIPGTIFPMLNFNMMFYFPFFLMYTYFVCDNRKSVMDWFRQHKKYVLGIMRIWTMLVIISIFMPSCYHTKEAGNIYFGSFCGSIFRLGPSAMFIQVLSIISMVYYKRRKDIIFQIIPLFCAYMGSSRTYLIVCVLMFVVAWYIFCTRRQNFWATLIPMVAVILWLVGQTAIGGKIETTLDEDRYGDFWFRITSSRSVIWEAILQDLGTKNFYQRLVGVDLNHSIWVAGLWAHNDFIELLGSFGIIGFVHYIYAIIHMLRAGYGRTRVPVICSVCVFMAWLCNAFLNMHYTYFCAMLCLPLLVFTLRDYSEEKYGVRKSKYMTVQHTQKTEG